MIIYRNSIKFFKSTTGKAISLLCVLVIGTMMLLSVISVKPDKDTLEIKKLSSVDETELHINGNTVPFQKNKKKHAKKKQVIEESSAMPFVPGQQETYSDNSSDLTVIPEVSAVKKNRKLPFFEKSNRPPNSIKRKTSQPLERRIAQRRRDAAQKRSANPRKKISLTLYDSGDNSNDDFISERYAPYGRLIGCKLINSIESGNLETPLIAMVMEDLWWVNQYGEKKLIIPAGTELLGKVNGSKPERNKLTSQGNFTFVWQITSNMVGFELTVTGVILEKNEEAGNKSRSTINNMSAGISGEVVQNESIAKMLAYTLAFGQGLAQGYQDKEVYTNNSSIIEKSNPNLQNAISTGATNMLQLALQDVTQQIAKESFYIRVPAGKEFYLFVTQVIDLDKAKIANTIKTEAELKRQQNSQMGNLAPDLMSQYNQLRKENNLK